MFGSRILNITSIRPHRDVLLCLQSTQVQNKGIRPVNEQNLLAVKIISSKICGRLDITGTSSFTAEGGGLDARKIHARSYWASSGRGVTYYVA